MTVAPSRPRAALALGAIALAAATLGGCTSLRGHTGFVVDTDLVNSVQPGVDTRSSVQQVLGQPTFTGQFGSGEWYYLARDTKSYAIENPKPSSQITLKIAFDANDTVASVTRMDETQVASIDPSNRVTPTLGRKRSFFQELFGNIGAVGTPGLGNGGSAGNPNDTP